MPVRYMYIHTGSCSKQSTVIHMFCCECTSITIQFTTGQSFWVRMKEQLEWKWGRNYAPRGPTSSHRLICFLEDLHNSAPAGSPGELARGHVSSGGVWEGGSSNSQRWHSVVNTSYLCTACCSRDRPLDLRLAKHFTVLHWDGYG